MSICVLGVDQGHSKTLAVVGAADGTLLGLGAARGAGQASDGLPVALAAIEQAARAALAKANRHSDEIAWLVGGLTDADWPDESAMLTQALTALGLAEHVMVKNDSLIALRSGTAAPYGAVLIAGSGANCAVRSPAGEEWIYGCYAEAEVQGGGALGRMALRAVYRAATLREPPTSLTQALLAACHADSVDVLLRADVEKRLPVAVRHLAPYVFECAEAGDAVAQRLLRQLALGLAELVIAGLRRLSLTEIPVEVVLAGGLFQGRSMILLETLRAAIAAQAPQARLVEARYEPVVGAVLLAWEAAGLPFNAAMAERLEASSRALGLRRDIE